MTTSGWMDDPHMPAPGPGTTTTDTANGIPPLNAETAGVAAEEAKGLGRDAAQQASQVMSQVKQEMEGQALQTRDKLTNTLRSLGDEMEQMALNGASDSLPAQALTKLAQSARTSAEFLDQRDPGSLMNEFEQFARRRPGLFLAGAAIAGTVAGRATRSAVDKRGTTPSYEPRLTEMQVPDSPAPATANPLATESPL